MIESFFLNRGGVEKIPQKQKGDSKRKKLFAALNMKDGKMSDPVHIGSDRGKLNTKLNKKTGGLLARSKPIA